MLFLSEHEVKDVIKQNRKVIYIDTKYNIKPINCLTAPKLY